MSSISFRTNGFTQGVSYYAELLLNESVVDTKYSLIENTLYSFQVLTPGTYTVKVKSTIDDECVDTKVIQALYPIVTFDTTDVDCNSNTYTFSINLTNPLTAGTGVQYGWSLFSDCSTVTNWSTENNIILSADNTTRYLFVRNNVAQCCDLISTTVEEPCEVCKLQIINIVFNCNG